MATQLKVIEGQYVSSADKRKLCSYDVEFIEDVTRPIIHQVARFWFFTKGKAKIAIDGKSYDIVPNTLVAIMPWQTTEILMVKEPLCLEKIRYNFDVINNLIRTEYNVTSRFIKISDPIEEHPVLLLTTEEIKIVKGIMDVIRDEVGIESIYDEPDEKELTSLLVSNKIAELLIYFKRFINKKQCITKDGETIELEQRPAIFKYIYSHLADHPTLTQLSLVFNMSEEAISKYLMDVTGMSLAALANEMRIAKTTDLLIYTNLALTDIAFFVGYSDASHLIKNFNERVNSMPTQYREIYQAKEDIFKEKDRSIGYQVLSYILDHYKEDLHVTDVAKHYHLTVVELNQMLLFMIEKNFEEYLNYLRINEACKLLLSSKDSLIDIGVAVGYNNIKTFSRNFVKAKGMTPGDFRKLITINE